jgi:taurine dioxygenase
MTQTQLEAPDRYESIEVRPLALHLGAEIRGADLSRPLPPAQVRDIWSAFLRWKVVFFRDQSLDHPGQIAFARHFGELTPGHVVFGEGEAHPEIYSVAKFRRANSKRGTEPLRPWSGWHTDITAAVNPPAASILRGEVVPPYGGDTMWSNLAVAYRALSEPVRRFVDGLRAVHSFDRPQGSSSTRAYDEMVERRGLAAEHPLVRVHPETGERVLYVSPNFLKTIVGVTPQESLHLLEMLWEHAVRPEFTVRFKWEPGSIAFWDNRATCHLAPRDIFESDFERQFYRVTLLGDIPVGVDGVPSKALEGGPIAAVSPAA